MIGRFGVLCLGLTAASAVFVAWNVWRYRSIGPLTTVVPYALTAKRLGLEGDQGLRDGIQSVVDLLQRIHGVLDGTFVQARTQLEERLRTDVQIADSASGIGKAGDSSGRLLNVGVTAKALADVDRCEYFLRQAAGLAAQIIIDVDEEGAARVSAATYGDFNAQISAAIDQLEKLEKTAKVLAGEWTQRSIELARAREALQTRWGILEERSSAPSLLRDAARAEIGSADLERIGQEQLDTWRKRAGAGGGR